MDKKKFKLKAKEASKILKKYKVENNNECATLNALILTLDNPLLVDDWYGSLDPDVIDSPDAREFIFARIVVLVDGLTISLYGQSDPNFSKIRKSLGELVKLGFQLRAKI